MRSTVSGPLLQRRDAVGDRRVRAQEGAKPATWANPERRDKPSDERHERLAHHRTAAPFVLVRVARDRPRLIGGFGRLARLHALKELEGVNARALVVFRQLSQSLEPAERRSDAIPVQLSPLWLLVNGTPYLSSR